MLIPRVVWTFSIGVLIVLGPGVVSGQDYPNKPIRILAGTGGVGNFVSRLISPVLTESLGQQVIVDNRSGILGEVASRAPPDGYTLLIDSGTFWLGPSLQKMSYDPVRDFSPITLATTSPNILVVHPSVAANSVKELIALARAKPGALNFGSGGAEVVANSPEEFSVQVKSEIARWGKVIKDIALRLD